MSTRKSQNSDPHGSPKTSYETEANETHSDGSHTEDVEDEPSAEDDSGQQESELSPAETGATAQKTNALLLSLTALLVVFLTVRALIQSGVTTNTGSLEVPALADEKTDLPPALAKRDLPLESLRSDLIGSRLDKPRAYVALYSKKAWGGAAWGEGNGLKEAIKVAFESAQKKKNFEASHAMLVIPTDQRIVSSSSLGRSFSNVHKGVRGAFVESELHEFRISPTHSIATNRTVVEELKAEADRKGFDYKTWVEQAKVYSVDARQFFVPLDSEGPAVETLRGNRVIQTEEVTESSVRKYEELLTGWLFNNLTENGRLTYIYYPSNGRESRGNNMIRQWMGSVAMGRAARIHKNPSWAIKSYKNIRYNLEEFYHEKEDLGYIEYRDQVKLGAAALSMISIIESPRRQQLEKFETGLFNTTMHLWRESGRFYTFLKPEKNNDKNHNFYPGETLLAWSFLYAQNEDPRLLERSMKSFAHYKDWHKKNRSPAFVPWHTQAYYQLYLKTKNPDLADWMFEMNDWLVDVMQAKSRVAYDDTLGRFYAPSNRRYGSPHASSTGVYLEGLIDAFTLARSIGDKKHEEKYRKAIILGLRSGMQLQFQDEIDMFYASHHERLKGGMRTTVYDNEIRVDNVQHILMGVQKILKEFKPEDYEL